MPRPGNTSSPLLLAILALLLAAPPAAGQTGAPTPLRIETRDLEREVGAAREALGTLPEGQGAAVLQNRLTAIEEELRRLTGRVEEAEFREQQTRERIDRLVADLDRRLAAFEQRPTAALDDQDGAMPEALAALPPTGEAASADQMPAVQDEAPLPEGASLGTIPRDAILGIPAPSGDGPTGTAPAAALEGSSPGRFSAALDLLQTGDYDAAEVAFARWIDDFPEDPQAPVASYWLGEAQLARGDHANAAATFAANYRTFGAEAPRAADNLLKLGTALAAMGDTTRACQTFDEMGRRYQGVSSGLRQALERERRAAGCT
jgi:tol-pal system protein YbgF